MKKVYKCLSDGDSRDHIVIDNEEKYCSLFWFETKTYDEDTGELYDNCIAISKEDALDLANAIIKELNK